MPEIKESIFMANKKHVVGVDLGGTKILAAVVNREGGIMSRVKRRTHPEMGDEKVIERIAKSIREAVKKAKLSPDDVMAIGIGAPGPIDIGAGIIYNAPNLGWDEVNLKSRLSKKMKGLPVHLENDVNAGTFGEYILGAARGAQDVVGIFPGTGVGGGIIAGGRLHHGFRDGAAEIGHMVMMVDGPLCGCGRHGCAEALASRTAITRDIKAALSTGRKSIVTELSDEGLGHLTSGMLAKAWKAGDEVVCEVLERAQKYLGILTGSIVNLIDPEIVVFGGGLIEAMGDEFLEPVRRIARNYFIMQRNAENIKIVPTQLGDLAVLLGASMIAYEQVLGEIPAMKKPGK